MLREHIFMFVSVRIGHDLDNFERITTSLSIEEHKNVVSCPQIWT